MAARATFVIWALALLTAWLIPVLAFSPGAYTPDTAHQVGQAITNVYDDWHPPLMAAWWHVLIRTFGSPSALLWFHNALLLATLLLFARLLVRDGARWTAALLVAVPLLPTVVNFSGVLWKDIGCGFSLGLAAVAAALSSGRARAVLVPVTLVACYYAAGVRVNAIPAVFPILVLALWPSGPARVRRGRPALRAVALAGAGTVFCAVAPPIFASRVLHAQKARVPGLLQLMDLAGVRHYTGFDAIPDFALSSPGVTRQEIEAQYVRSADYGSVSWLFWADEGKPPPFRLPRNDQESALLTRAWIEAITHHPGAYLRHRAVFMRKLLRIGESSGYYHYVLPEEPSEVRPLFASALPEIRREVSEDLAMKIPFSAACRRVVKAIMLRTGPTPLFLSWIWIVLEVGLLGASIALRHRAPRLTGLAAAASASGILYCASYFPVMPASDFRYLYWTTFAGVIALVATIAALWTAAFPAAKTSSR